MNLRVPMLLLATLSVAGALTMGCGSGSSDTTTNGLPICFGAPVACSRATMAECSTLIGCTPSKGCTGIAKNCDGLQGAACSAQQGCSWDALASACIGLPVACDKIVGTCSSQAGCEQAASPCVGDAGVPNCEGLSQDQCGSQFGCQWGLPY